MFVSVKSKEMHATFLTDKCDCSYISMKPLLFRSNNLVIMELSCEYVSTSSEKHSEYTVTTRKDPATTKIHDH